MKQPAGIRRFLRAITSFLVFGAVWAAAGAPIYQSM